MIRDLGRENQGHGGSVENLPSQLRIAHLAAASWL
jgi:hypothetical protein